MSKVDVTLEHGLDETGTRVRYGITIDGVRDPQRLVSRLNRLVLMAVLAGPAAAVLQWFR